MVSVKLVWINLVTWQLWIGRYRYTVCWKLYKDRFWQIASQIWRSCSLLGWSFKNMIYISVLNFIWIQSFIFSFVKLVELRGRSIQKSILVMFDPNRNMTEDSMLASLLFRLVSHLDGHHRQLSRQSWQTVIWTVI